MQVYQLSRKQRMKTIWWTVLWLSHSHVAPHSDRTRAYCIDQDSTIPLLVGMGPSWGHWIKRRETGPQNRWILPAPLTFPCFLWNILPFLQSHAFKYLHIISGSSFLFSSPPNSASIPTICCFNVASRKSSIHTELQKNHQQQKTVI